MMGIIKLEYNFMKKVYIVHGWSGAPDANWFPWMKKELDALGIAVEILHMPNADFPQKKEWVEYIHEKIVVPNEEVFLVGHSLGCMAIMCYVASLEQNEKIGGMLLVAGFSRSIGIPYLENFFEAPLDYDAVENHVERCTIITSDDDPYVPIGEGKYLEEKLNGKLIVLNGAGHINKASGFLEFPLGMEQLLQMMQ